MEKSAFNFPTSTAVHLLDNTSLFSSSPPSISSKRPLVLHRCNRLTKDLVLLLNLWDALLVFFIGWDYITSLTVR